jgi:lipoprotein-anchoring transpeptidase ErfK/SrfK
MNHFYFGSVIDCINVSGKTVQEAEKLLPSELQAYTLYLKERGGKTDKITAADIGLKYNSDGQVQNLKDEQNPFKWILTFFNAKDPEILKGVSFDKQLLKEQLDKLSCFNSSNITLPKNPSFKYTNNGYVIVDEVYGNKVNYDVLFDHVVNAISKFETTIDLESIECYAAPQYTSNSQKVIDIKNMLNKYISSIITYTFGKHSEILDGLTINKWLKIDENLEVTFDETKVKDYLAVLSNTYNTVGITRNFVTSLGKTIKISGGDYGWKINTSKEAQNLISAIKEGQTIMKEPAYIQTASSHDTNDIGNTYIEINLSKQHLWYYKNGSLIVQGDVVTGNISHNNPTPPGIYMVKYKQKNATLNGPDYSSPVTFWMPFNGGIGLHDASWRSVFGGNIYKTNGSHGCVNAPYYLAKTVFNSIQPGDPVVCYY